MNEVAPNQQNLIIYNTLDGKVSVTMMVRDGNVWMNQKQMAELLRVVFKGSRNLFFFFSLSFF